MISFKQRSVIWVAKAIIPIGISLLITIYYLAFHPTVLVYQQHNQNCTAETSSELLSVSPGYTDSRARLIQSGYGKFVIDTVIWKSQLWNTASGLSRKYDCKITTYNDFQKEMFDDKILFRQKIGFSGNYFALIKLLDELEKLKGIGKVSSLNLVKKTRETELAMDVDFLGLQKN